MTRQRELVDLGFDKGIFVSSDPGSIPDGYMPECKDFYVSQIPNELLVRPGFQNIAETNWPLSADWMTLYRTPNRNEIVCANKTNNKLYVQDQIGNVTQYSSVSQTGSEYAVQYGDSLYIITSNGGVYEYDGSTVAAIASTPNGVFASVMRDRLFVVYPNSSRVGYSDPGDFTTFGGASFLDVGVPGDGGWTEALAPVGDRLLMFKNNAVWALVFSSTDPAYWSQKLLSENVGCISKFSVVNINGIVYFAAHEGIYRSDGFSVEPISDPINRAVFPSGIETTASSIQRTLTAGKWGDHYVFSTATHNDDRLIYLFNTRLGTWHSWTTPTGTLFGYFVEFPNMYWGSTTAPVNTLIMMPPAGYELGFSYLASLAEGGSKQYSYYEYDEDETVKFVTATLTTKRVGGFDIRKIQEVLVSAASLQNATMRVQPLVNSRVVPDKLMLFKESGESHNFRTPIYRYGSDFGATISMSTAMAPEATDITPTIYSISLGLKSAVSPQMKSVFK